MKVIIAPARTMKIDEDSFPYQDLPEFLPETAVAELRRTPPAMVELQHPAGGEELPLVAGAGFTSPPYVSNHCLYRLAVSAHGAGRLF